MAIKIAGKTLSQVADELGSNWSGSEKKWYTAAETAALIRVRLKSQFPKSKFKVQTDVYSGGASVRIYWTPSAIDLGQGVTLDDVQRVAGEFEPGTFNGMIDMYEYHKGGMFLLGKPVSYGINYIFVYQER